MTKNLGASYDCGFYLYETDDDQIGVDMDIFWEIGTEHLQDTTFDDETYGTEYKLDWTFYSEQEVNVRPTIKLERFILAQVEGQIEKFKATFVMDIRMYNGNYSFQNMRNCFDIYLFTEPIKFVSQFYFKGQECYKDVIECIWDFNNWAGFDARWIDKCKYSDDEQTVIWEYDMVPNDLYYSILGTHGDTQYDPTTCVGNVFGSSASTN